MFVNPIDYDDEILACHRSVRVSKTNNKTEVYQTNLKKLKQIYFSNKLQEERSRKMGAKAKPELLSYLCQWAET